MTKLSDDTVLRLADEANVQAEGNEDAWACFCLEFAALIQAELGKDVEKYVSCILCGHFITWFEHSQMRFSLDCPECKAAKQFGPGVYVEDFNGRSIAEAMEIRKNRRGVK